MRQSGSLLSLRSEIILIFLGRVATAALALGALRLATGVLSPAQYGQYSLLVAVQAFCGLFLVNPVGQHLNRHTHEWWDDGSLRARLRSYGRYILLVGLIGALATAPIGSRWEALGMSAAMLVMVVAATWNATLVPMLNMLGQRAASVVWAVGGTAIGLAASYALTRVWPGATAWFLGQAIGMGAGAAGAQIALARALGPSQGAMRLPLIDRATAIAYCVPLALATGCMWLQLSGYRFVVGQFWGLAALGIVALGMGLATQLWALVETFVFQLLMPLFYRRISGGDQAEGQRALSDLINTVVPIYLILTAAGIVAASALLRLLVDARYAAAAPFLVTGLIVELCRAAANIIGSATQVTRRPAALLIPYLCGAMTMAVILGGGVSMGQEVGIVAPGLAIAAVVMVSAMTVSMHRQVPFHIDLVRWLVAGVILAAAGAAGTADWWTATTAMAAALTIGAVGLAAAAAMAAVLIKNPAAMRLFDTRLDRATPA